jgi:hypothetical protein
VTDETTDTTSVPIGEAAQTLLASGAKPFVPDVEEMMRQMQALQTRIAAMEAEKGVPADPIVAAVGNLQDHVQAKVNAHPGLELNEISTVVKELADHPNINMVTVVRELLGKLIKRYRHVDFSYVEELATDLATAVLKSSAL